MLIIIFLAFAIASLVLISNNLPDLNDGLIFFCQVVHLFSNFARRVSLEAGVILIFHIISFMYIFFGAYLYYVLVCDAISNIKERKKEFKKGNQRASLCYQISKNTQAQSLSERERKTKNVGRKFIQLSGKSCCYNFRKLLNSTTSCCSS